MNPISRRDAIKLGAAGAAGLAMGTGTLAEQAAAPKTKAKCVIQIWMWGGPCHIDTFDPKPEAGYDYCGPLDKPIGTNVDGMQISELMPTLAQQADKFSLVRGMTHGNNGHETAAYLVQTGHTPGDQSVFPSIGAVVAHFKGYGAGYKGLLPPYIVLTEPQGRFSEAGFLGGRCKPFATGGDPGANQFTVEGIVAPGITFERQEARRDLLKRLNTLEQSMRDDQGLAAFGKAEERAYDLILGEEGKIFDLAQEETEVRDAYGRTKFGQSCLLARRLVEKGIPYITINYGGWDTHKQHFQTMRRKLPELDRGLASLLKELSERGLLDSTIVWCCGEFGRTPRVQWDPPWDGGRNHFGNAFSALVAGGGFKGGQVIGSTDKTGERVKDRPCHPVDLIGSMYDLMGIAPDATLPHPRGPVALLPPVDEGLKTGGRLKEIM